MAIPVHDWTGLTLPGGRYVIRSKLGEGGMGFVYRAWDRNLDTDVVVKVPRRAMLDDPEFADRFAREVRALVSLTHPSIVRISDVGEHDGLPFAVMQYLSGGSLDDRRPAGPDGRPRAVDPSSLRDWLPTVARALDFVHRSGYVHRDVKPANVLFDGHGNPFLGDFGVAKVITASAQRRATTGTGIVLGTPEYMAPEIVMGQPFDGRADQYALAVVVFELLSGRHPFEADNPTAILVKQTTQPPPDLRGLCPTLPPALGAVVHRGLAKEPAGRYPTCADLAAAVVEAAATVPAGESRSAVPVGAIRRLPCPGCSAPISLSPAMAGKRGRCPACGTRVQIAADLGSLSPIAPAAPAGGTVALSAPRPTPGSTTIPLTSPAAGRPPAVEPEAPLVRPVPTGLGPETIALAPPVPPPLVTPPLAFHHEPIAPAAKAARPNRLVPVLAGASLVGCAGLAVVVLMLLRTGTPAPAPSAEPTTAAAETGRTVVLPPVRPRPAPVAVRPAPAEPEAAAPDGNESSVASTPDPAARTEVSFSSRAEPERDRAETAAAGPMPATPKPPRDVDAPLEEVVGDPDRFAGDHVTTSAAVKVGSKITPLDGDRFALPITNWLSSVKAVEPRFTYRDVRFGFGRGLADSLRRFFIEMHKAPSIKPEIPALITFTLSPASEGAGARYEAEITRIELQFGLDVVRLFSGSGGDVFRVATVTDRGYTKGIGDYARWLEARGGNEFVGRIRGELRKVLQAKTRDQQKVMFDRVMSQSIGSAVKQDQAANQMLLDRVRRGGLFR